MTEDTFRVVFKGKVVRGYEADKAIDNFAKLFKIPKQKASLMFDGKERVLKKSLLMDKAAQFRAVLKKAGIRVSLIKNEIEKPSLGSDQWELNDPGTVILQPIRQPEVHIETSHMRISLDDSTLESQPGTQPLDVSIDHIKIDDSEEPIIEEKEVEVPYIDTDNISVDEPGSVIVNAKKVETPDIPIDALSMDEIGITIIKKKQIDPPEIDISSISLAGD